MNYLLSGRDPFPKEKLIGELKARLILPQHSDMNTSVFDAESDDIRDMLAAAGTMPFGGQARLVIIKRAQSLNKESASALSAYLKNPSKSTTLVLDCDRQPERSGPWADITPAVKYVNFDSKGAEDLTALIDSEFAAYEKTADRDAVALIKQLTAGRDMSAVRSEVAKAAIYAGPGDSHVTRAHVEAVVGQPVESDVFKLIDTISRKDTDRALSMIEDLVTKKAKPYEIVGLLAWYFRKIYMSDKSVFAKKKKMKKVIDLLLKTDHSLKRYQSDPGMVLDMTMMRLTSGNL